VREAGNTRTVQIVRESVVHSAKVETGIRTGSRYEILSGLAEGDSVVLTRGTEDGARVRAQEARR